jgi:hypothetical protein
MNYLHYGILTASLFTVLTTSVALADETLVESFDESSVRPPKEKASAQLVQGHQGKAIEFRFEKDSQNVFFNSSIRGQPIWDMHEGLSFWVKGDGSSDVGVLHFIYDDDYSVRYEYAFSLKDNQWHQLKVAWRDLVPTLPGPNSKFFAGQGGNKPSKLSALWIGKWWHWRDYPPHSFALDELRLEPRIERPRPEVPAGLARLRSKLEAGLPITIVTMGDSLTDDRHWANRKIVWPILLKHLLEQKYKSKVTIVNPAVGGTQLRQGLAQIPRWAIETPEPDLVTMCFGGND